MIPKSRSLFRHGQNQRRWSASPRPLPARVIASKNLHLKKSASFGDHAPIRLPNLLFFPA
jgi:hypothetical protein